MQKQVSCFFQAQTEGSTLANNICFNGPRAGFNFNDGMAGGNVLTNNLVFNMVPVEIPQNTIFQIERAALHGYGPDAHSC